MRRDRDKTAGGVLKTGCGVLIVLALVVAFGVEIAWGAAAVDIDAKIAAEERRRKELDQKLESYRNSIQQMKVKENDLLVRIDRSQQATEKARQEMTLLEYQIGKLQKDIGVLNENMDQTKQRIENLVFGLKQRMVDIAKYGISEELLLIFSAETTHAVLDSIYLLEKLNQHDQFLIEQLLDKKQEIELSRQILQEHRARLQQRAQSLEQERKKYNSTIKQTNTYLNDIRRQKALAERAAREMEEAQKAVGQTILTLMRQKKEREAAAKKAGGKGSIDYLAGRIAQGRGSMFDWPLRGPLSSSFGSRVHPVFKTKSFHSGIDLSAPRGTPVKAAAPGEVLFEGWMRGYGQVVIIDHGRNYSTVYAHMSSTQVKEGTVVGAGTVIGTVGNTGTTTGYHLHFEVRVGSTAKNPLDYLKR